jgi:tRNA (cytidine/uridine-2'-O-)-methyltransferase
MRIALLEPDIPQNTGTILRLAACLGLEAHLIEPAGFPISDRAFRRAGMDYLDQVALVRHASWDAFDLWRRQTSLRVILFTTRASQPFLAHEFGASDILLFGRETSGAPDRVHAAADALAQCGHDVRDRGWGSVAADRPMATGASGADLTFATRLAASPRSECQIQKLHWHYDLLVVLMILTFANEPAAKGCEC